MSCFLMRLVLIIQISTEIKCKLIMFVFDTREKIFLSGYTMSYWLHGGKEGIDKRDHCTIGVEFRILTRLFLYSRSLHYYIYIQFTFH